MAADQKNREEFKDRGIMSFACEKCRSAGEKLMLKGERCLSPKCAMIKRPYGPGAHGTTGPRSKKSEYGRQLAEKQRAKEIYGIREAQFRNYIAKAEKITGNTAENLVKLLELRLDNVIFRLGLAVSRAQARQMVSHGLVSLNGKKVNIPSYTTKEKDIISPKYKEKYKEMKIDHFPSWLDFNQKSSQGVVKHLPIREEIDTPINENLIIEFYSR
jgi:small subunit ribosomal protein S4